MNLAKFPERLPLKSSNRRKAFHGLLKLILILSAIISIQVTSLIFHIAAVFGQSVSTVVSPVVTGTTTSRSVMGIAGGQQVSLDVRVDNIIDPAGLAAFTFRLNYNPSLLYIADTNSDYIADSGLVSVGSFLGSSGKGVSCSQAYIDQDPANSSLKRLTFTCLTLGLTPAGAAGSGVLATIKFKTGNTIGPQTLTLTNTQLANNTQNPTLITHTTGSLFILTAKCADFNGDHLVTISDILYIVGKYYTTDQAADLNGDGIVLIDDILIAVAEYYQTC